MRVVLITTGNCEVIVAGGSDSLSNPAIKLPTHLASALGLYQMGGGNKLGFQGVKQFFQVNNTTVPLCHVVAYSSFLSLRRPFMLQIDLSVLCHRKRVFPPSGCPLSPPSLSAAQGM